MEEASLKRLHVAFILVVVLAVSLVVVLALPLVQVPRASSPESTAPEDSASSGTIYIRSDGSVDPDIAPVRRDRDVYTLTGNINGSIVVERDNIEVDGTGYILQGIGTVDSIGIDLSFRSNVAIKNTTIKRCGYGIRLVGSSNNTIIGNKMTNIQSSGIELKEGSNSNRIFGNQIENNVENRLCRGIYLLSYLQSSSENSIYENTITNNEWGIALDGSSRFNSVSGNCITNNSVGIALDDSTEGNTITGNYITKNGYGIHLRYHSGKNTVSGNDISNNGIGISFEGSSNNLLRNNTMNNNNHNFNVDEDQLSYLINDVDKSNTVDGRPIYYWVNQQSKTIPSDAGYVALVNCTDITVQNLNLTNNGEGILLAYTTNSIIAKNNLANCDYGVLLHNSSHNTINENNIKNIRLNGIELKEGSNSNRIFGNHIETGIGTGIDFFGAMNNSIVGNNITNCNVGVFVSGSPNNIIHHNNFINNTKQVNDVYYVLFFGSPTVNIWDNGSEGNYWDNYAGVDKDGDGIGDTPHIVYEKNQDNHPLMNPRRT